MIAESEKKGQSYIIQPLKITVICPHTAPRVWALCTCAPYLMLTLSLTQRMCAARVHPSLIYPGANRRGIKARETNVLRSETWHKRKDNIIKGVRTEYGRSQCGRVGNIQQPLEPIHWTHLAKCLKMRMIRLESRVGTHRIDKILNIISFLMM